MGTPAGAEIDRPAAPRRERTALVVLAISLLGLALRALYFTGAEVSGPIRGDIIEYWNYAWNLVHHGVFSSAMPAAAAPAADAWRGPGYPVFLALCLRLGGDAHALGLAQWTQLLIGASLAPLTIALGRCWLPNPWALLAGLLVAVWPHLVVFSSTLLAETLFSFLLLLAALAAARAQARDSLPLAAGAGLLAGLAALVNPLLLLFPPVLALLLALRGQRRAGLSFLLAFMLVAGAWELRNASLHGGNGAAQRAQTNLVQGSWPQYHDAVNDRDRNEIAAAYFGQIEEEVARMHADPHAGLAAMATRFREQPALYARWYLLQKPWLLWDWRVRVGWGDIYFLQTTRSPFERVPALRAIRAVALALNPALFVLALLAVAAVAWRQLRRRAPAAAAPEFALLQLALLFCYLTAVHVVLQAEPRYAVAYRPIEFLLAVAALAMLGARLRRGRQEPPA